MIITPYIPPKGKASGNLIFRFKMDDRTYNLLCSMPGFKKWEGRALIFRPIIANVQYILEHFPNATWDGGSDAAIAPLRKLQADASRVIAMKHGPLPVAKSDGYQYKRLPREHQRRALLMSWNRAAFALLMEQRTGKTKVIIDNAAYLWKLGKLHTLIIITINGVHRNWIDNEIPEDLPDWCHRETFFMRPGHNGRQQRAWMRMMNLTLGLRIASFNIESLSREGKARDLLEEVIGDGTKVMVAIDESSDCIKTWDSARTTHVIKATKKVEYKRILTGTQVPEGRPDELFPQYTFLDPDILRFDVITPFRARYCKYVQMEVTAGNKIDVMVPGCKNVEELQGKIEGHSYRVRRKDCMDLPDKIYKRWPIELSKDQRRIYDELRKEYTTEFKGKTLSAGMAMTRAIRLQQIVCGWFPMDRDDLIAGETWDRIIPIDKVNPRLLALDDILRTHPGPTIIWANFRPDLEMIQKHLGKRAVSYHGGIKADQKAKNYRAFQHTDEFDYFIGNPSSAGRGLTMTRATVMVYYSNSFRLSNRLQSEDRGEGNINKRDSTLIIDLEAVRTVDQKTIKALRLKKDMADLINGDPKSIFMESDEE